MDVLVYVWLKIRHLRWGETRWYIGFTHPFGSSIGSRVTNADMTRQPAEVNVKVNCCE